MSVGCVENQRLRARLHESSRLRPSTFRTPRHCAWRRSKKPKMRTSLLCAIPSTSHVHLIIGTNSIAATRVSQSLAVGAKPVLIVAPDAPVHFSLHKRIEENSIEWIKKTNGGAFEEEDLYRYGREEVGGWADAVFITEGGRSLRSTLFHHLFSKAPS